MIEKLIEKVMDGAFLSEKELQWLCRQVVSILVEESNVQMIPAPVSICGDIHGQFRDLIELFKVGGEVPKTRYIFMGDFVDRGYNSLETLTLLLLLKAKHPDSITLLRGNHESRQITSIYGFYDEIQRKYGCALPWQWCAEVFDAMSLAAVVEQKAFCVHGGLSPEVVSLDQIRVLRRMCEIPNEGAFCDLMWSDPAEEVDTWAVSPRGAGYLFGEKVAAEWCRRNNLEVVCRAHQLVQDGFKYHYEADVKSYSFMTVWSAPNYCYRCGNVAAILELNEQLDRNVLKFTDVQPQHTANPQKPEYFL
eukprot:TRINITY_DN3202_c5_g1_i1.p1 TRINITY_DN3202_c5_g1~~TRINITY_DN3202_c5_g1_i1.p1  ORF type:complete len:306 (+),score=36.65 TRINITY_DN3202_c5_g1_i1:99-1016(+)